MLNNIVYAQPKIKMMLSQKIIVLLLQIQKRHFLTIDIHILYLLPDEANEISCININ